MKRFIKTLLHNLLLAFLAFVWLVPIVWLVVTSFSAYTGMNTSTFSRRNGVWRSIRICFSLRTVWHSSRTGSRTPSSLHVWYV